jgi:hypothetical protein
MLANMFLRTTHPIPTSCPPTQVTAWYNRPQRHTDTHPNRRYAHLTAQSRTYNLITGDMMANKGCIISSQVLRNKRHPASIHTPTRLRRLHSTLCHLQHTSHRPIIRRRTQATAHNKGTTSMWAVRPVLNIVPASSMEIHLDRAQHIHQHTFIHSIRIRSQMS